MLTSRAGRLESKVFTGPHQCSDPLDHDPASGQRHALYIVRRQASGDLVGIDELTHTKFVRKQILDAVVLPAPLGAPRMMMSFMDDGSSVDGYGF